ncbi:hypothetical protein ES703_42177 [subsurface metagenome]
MEWVAIGIIIVWAVIHSYVDLRLSKKVDRLEKELQAHKH